MAKKDQKKLDIEQTQSEGRKNRLVEIYKIHVQYLSNENTLQTTINRFYPTVMSGLFAFLFAFLQRKDDIFPDVSEKERIVGYSITVVGYLGVLLSTIWWFTSMHFQRRISRKWRVLLELEKELDFQFFSQDSALRGKSISNVLYSPFYRFEFFMPFAFAIVFAALFYIGMSNILTGEFPLPFVTPQETENIQ